MLFVGRQAKNAVVEELFPGSAFGYCSHKGVATLRVDDESAGSDHPIFLAESSPDQVISLAAEDSCSCESQSFPLQWAEGIPVQRLYNLLHARLLCLFANVLFVFADDFADFDQVIQLLESWAAAGSASVQFNQARPRVVIIRRGEEVSPSPTYDLLHMENLQQGLYRRSLKEFFPRSKCFIWLLSKSVHWHISDNSKSSFGESWTRCV